MKLAPSKVKVENKWSPSQINNGDTEGYLLDRLEHNSVKDQTVITTGFAYGLPKLADNVALWLEGNVIANNLKEFSGDLSAVAAYNKQYFVGTKVLGNLQTRKLSEAHGFVAAEFENNFVYLNSNCLARKIKLGFSTPNIQYLQRLAGETQIELDENYQLKGTPTSNIAFSNKINDDTTLKVKFDISKDIHFHFSCIHKLSKNLSFTVGDSFNPLGLHKNSGKEIYNFGVSLEANL